MTLKTTQQSILDNLRTLLLTPTIGLRSVYLDAPDSISDPPCLVLFDEGFLPQRLAQWERVEWRLRFQVFVQRGTLPAGLKLAREIRADLIDRLDTSLALSLPEQVATTYGDDGFRLVNLLYPADNGTEFVGFEGTYLVHISDRNKTFT